MEHQQPRDAGAGSPLPADGRGGPGDAPGWGMALHVLPQGWLSPKAVSNKRFPVVASTGCLEGGK